jgi:methylated-DNA-[protein]-cysteine S-methyltransferase
MMWEKLLDPKAGLVTKGFDGPLGRMTLAAKGDLVAGLWFDGQERLPGEAQKLPEDPGHPTLLRLEGWLKDYFGGIFRKPPKVAILGTPFQEAVWKATLGIPLGETSSYRDVARRVAKGGGGGSPRAVGAALARNPIGIIVPCHRVLAQGGGLRGYAGGLWRKKALLELEGAAFSG